MPLSLICNCGARIELEDALAGQEVACPECQQPLKAPVAGQSQPIRTSGFALASLVLAVTGAFTIVGTLAAIVLGLIAVAVILRQRDRLAGLGYALAGIIVGVLFTGLTLFAVIAAEPLGVNGWMRERSMGEFVDTTGPREAVGKHFAVTRPDETWGVARHTEEVGDPIADLFLKKSLPEVLLVQIKNNAFLDVREEATGKDQTLDQFQLEYLEGYQSKEMNGWDEDPKTAKEEGFMRLTNGIVKRNRRLPDGPNGMKGVESEVEVLAAGQKWMMLVRIYHDPANKRAYILRAYSPQHYFIRNKSDFEKALDSFRLVK